MVAFTLAEVLITLTIIGVVAVLVMQTIIAPYQKMVTEVQLKKAYSLLVNAGTQALADENFNYTPPEVYEVKMEENDYYGIFAAYFAPYMNAKEIKSKAVDWYPTTPAGMAVYYLLFSKGCYQINNGMSFRMVNHSNNYFYIVVDLNGKSGPNRVGRDVFYFALHFTDNGVKIDGKVLGVNNYTTMKQLIRRCGKEENEWSGGSTCTEIIMRNDWKIPDDYPW